MKAAAFIDVASKLSRFRQNEQMMSSPFSLNFMSCVISYIDLNYRGHSLQLFKLGVCDMYLPTLVVTFKEIVPHRLFLALSCLWLEAS